MLRFYILKSSLVWERRFRGYKLADLAADPGLSLQSWQRARGQNPYQNWALAMESICGTSSLKRRDTELGGTQPVCSTALSRWKQQGQGFKVILATQADGNEPKLHETLSQFAPSKKKWLSMNAATCVNLKNTAELKKRYCILLFFLVTVGGTKDGTQGHSTSQDTSPAFFLLFCFV